MAKILIIESPNKVHTIESLFKDSVTVLSVLSTKAPIMEMSKKNLGIDENYNPIWEINDLGKKLKSKLLKCDKDDQFFIGTDADREGENIASHVYKILEQINYTNIKRVLFREISFKAIDFALNNPINLNLQLVKAQNARCVIDKLIGYTISPLMQKYLAKKSGAGRVQTPALRLFAEQSIKHDNFVKQIFFIPCIVLEDKNILLDKKFDSKQEVKQLIDTWDVNFIQFSISEKEVSDKTLTPFKTSTLIRKAELLFGFSPDKTMLLAQTLFEGKKINDNISGLITYLRTDSTRVSKEFLNNNIENIKKWGEIDLNMLTSVSDTELNVQDAHECIRPVDLNLHPGMIQDFLTPAELKLYSLIFFIFLGSCLKPPVYKNTIVKFKNIDKLTFSITNVDIVKNGYLCSNFMHQYFSKRKLQSEIFQKDLKVNFDIKKYQTAVPPLFTASALIEKLENLGIGRPSTFATIIPKLLEKTYIFSLSGVFKTTLLGKLAVQELYASFEEIFNYNFTAELEKKLDLIAGGETESLQVIKEFDILLKSLCSSFEEYISKLNSIETRCLKCSSEALFRIGKYGPYLTCLRHKYAVIVESFEKLQLKLKLNLKNAQILTNCTGCKLMLKKKYVLCDSKKRYIIYCFECKQVDYLTANEASAIIRNFFEYNAITIK